MTPERIRTVIAEDCGWTCDEFGDWYKQNGSGCNHVSHFTESLDAIRAAAMERFPVTTHSNAFTVALANSAYMRGPVPVWQLTALEWCEAYLRAVGRWEES